MAEPTEPTESLAKREAEPERDPIVSRSTSSILLICTLLMVGSGVWALWDEAFAQRPWRGIQREFVQRYTAYLKSIRGNAGRSEAEIKETPEYQQLAAAAEAADENTKERRKEIEKEVTQIQSKLDAVTDPFQNQRGRIVVITFTAQIAKSKSAKEKYNKQIEAKKAEQVTVEMPDGRQRT